MELERIAALRDRDLLAEGLVVAEGRLLAERLLAACRAAGSAGPVRAAPGAAALTAAPALLPSPRFEALGLACVPSLEPVFAPLAEGLCPLEVLSEPELAALVGYPFHRGVLAWARRMAPPPFDPAWLSPSRARDGALPAGPKRLLLLPKTVDPENFGAIMRSAAALGWDGILAGADSCDHLSRRAVRVSMGAAFSLPVLPLPGPSILGELAAAGWLACAAILDPGARDLRGHEGAERLALLVGNEFEGLGPEWLLSGVERLTIPMEAGSDSLNAAAAAAVFLWALASGT